MDSKEFRKQKFTAESTITTEKEIFPILILVNYDSNVCYCKRTTKGLTVEIPANQIQKVS